MLPGPQWWHCGVAAMALESTVRAASGTSKGDIHGGHCGVEVAPI